MVSVFFNCACPGSGYTLRKADYTERRMKSCSAEELTIVGYRICSNGGSYMALGSFEGKKYFHTRKSPTVVKDERGMKIETNLIFVGETAKDAAVVNRIAAYALFAEADYYRTMTSFIIFDGDSFTVDFDALQTFLKSFESSLTVETDYEEEKYIFNSIAEGSDEIFDFVVLESTWSYFAMQIQVSSNISPRFDFSLKEAKALAEKVVVVLPDGRRTESGVKASVKEPVTPPVVEPIAKEPVTPVAEPIAKEPVTEPVAVPADSQQVVSPVVRRTKEPEQDAVRCAEAKGFKSGVTVGVIIGIVIYAFFELITKLF